MLSDADEALVGDRVRSTRRTRPGPATRPAPWSQVATVGARRTPKAAVDARPRRIRAISDDDGFRRGERPIEQVRVGQHPLVEDGGLAEGRKRGRRDGRWDGVRHAAGDRARSTAPARRWRDDHLVRDGRVSDEEPDATAAEGQPDCETEPDEPGDLDQLDAGDQSRPAPAAARHAGRERPGTARAQEDVRVRLADRQPLEHIRLAAARPDSQCVDGHDVRSLGQSGTDPLPADGPACPRTGGLRRLANVDIGY